MMGRVLAVLLLMCGYQVAAAVDSYHLDNGMQVVLEENHASPMIAAMVFVKAGSKYEPPHINGVTHFLEHLLFNGTAARDADQLEPVIQLFGGYINAFTRKEMTGYLVLMPREHIDTGLAIVSDMLLNSILPAAKVEKERGIVTEEIRKDVDNPNYRVETAWAAFKHRGTPYARNVLGSPNTIATIERQEILDYYQTYYVPNNMITLVMGDFDTVEMRQKIQRYFGANPAGRLPEFAPVGYAPPARPEMETRYLDVPQRRLLVSFPAPHIKSRDYAAASLWVDYLNTGGRSPFLARIKTGPEAVASRASAYIETMEEFSELEIDLTLNEGVDSAAALAAVLAGLAEAARDLPADAEMAAMVTAAKADEYGLKERLHYYGIMRGHEFIVGGWDFISSRVDELARVTHADLKRVTAAYLGRPAYRAMYVAPPSETAAEEAPSSSLYLRRQFPNGLTAIVKSNADSRIFGAAVVFANRSACEPPDQTGIVDFCQRLLQKGAGRLDAAAISQRLAELGADLTVTDNPYIPYDDFYTSPQFSFIKYKALDESALPALQLLHQLVTEPTMDSAAVEQVRGELMGVLAMQGQSGSQAAANLYYEQLFGDGPLARNELGSARTLGGLSADDLRAFWKTYASPANMILAVATGAAPEEAMRWIERTFGSMPAVDPPPAVSQVKLGMPTGQDHRHEPMEKEQVQIYLGRPVIGPAHPDAPALEVATRILSERLSRNLRETQGLAYSVGAGIGFAPEFGWVTCRMGTGTENYVKALDGILGEVRGMSSTPPEAEELLRAKNRIRGQMLTRRLARENQCYYMALNEFMGLGYDWDDAEARRLEAVSAEDIMRVAGQYLSSEDYYLSTSGKLDSE